MPGDNKKYYKYEVGRNKDGKSVVVETNCSEEEARKNADRLRPLIGLLKR